MSLFKYMFDHDLLQRADIEALRSKSRRDQRSDRRKHRDARHRMEALEDEVAELNLLCRALLGTLQEAGQLDPAALQAAMERIDAEDGVIDGKATKAEEKPREPPAPVRRRKGR